MKGIRLLAILFLGCALLPTSCAPKAKPQRDQYTMRGYRPWIGPGWYYGIYFSKEMHYKNWRKKHYQRYRSYGPPKDPYKRRQMNRPHRRGRG